ncbi:universal stress protein [Flavobacterium sp. TMP13]|uniref:universal stress protein n=1 Tax=Flavobacterium sp. TMP13 TaxID=3425950 RepID=UPI003D774B66
MKRILVPTDFSENAENALKVAVQIAQKNNSEIILAHILELPNQAKDAIMGGTSIPEVMLFMKKAEEVMATLSQKPYLSNIKVGTITKLDRVSEGINTITKDNAIDLIVMGSHGTSGFEELLIGSNTEKVVRHSDIPVLVIKKEITNFKIDNLVFASDFSEEIKKPFQNLLDFASFFNSKLHLVLINTPNSFHTTKESDKIMNDFVSNFSLTNYTTQTYNDSNVESGIVNFAKSIDADVIGMCTHGRTGLSYFFNGSISEGLVNHTIRPIITFKI